MHAPNPFANLTSALCGGSVLNLPYLGYDSSTFELSTQIQPGLERWQLADLRYALQKRAEQEVARQEIHVYYYRINQTLAFPLPLTQRPQIMPSGIPGRPSYPWLTWLLWALEERWRLLHASWRILGDEIVGNILQTELAALAGWNSFSGWGGEMGLAAGHTAAVLTLALADATGWEPDRYTQVRAVAASFLERDIWPWFQSHWADKSPLAPHHIHNIPVIALVRSAGLAQAISHPHAAAFTDQATHALRAWWQFRLDPEAPHTEGTAYDGYLMDSFTEWLLGAPGRDELLDEGAKAQLSLAHQWIHLTLPGRLDIHAPLSDVEPEMPFWMAPLMRIALWYGHGPSRWLCQRLPPSRMPAAALVTALSEASQLSAPADAPSASPQALAGAVTLRTGWDEADLLAAIGCSRSDMSHLHNDSGQLLLGWHNRFWITDPGYQQYRPGEERDFSIGPQAHNGPVIAGQPQVKRRPILERLSLKTEEVQHAKLDLTGCYEGLPAQAAIGRTLWLWPGSAHKAVVVLDEIRGLAPGTELMTYWQGGAHLAWAFVAGWARLSDGQRTLWIGASDRALEPGMLERHAGSRGPLTLGVPTQVGKTSATANPQVQWWAFVLETQLSWQPPTLTATSSQIQIQRVDDIHLVLNNP